MKGLVSVRGYFNEGICFYRRFFFIQGAASNDRISFIEDFFNDD